MLAVAAQRAIAAPLLDSAPGAAVEPPVLDEVVAARWPSAPEPLPTRHKLSRCARRVGARVVCRCLQMFAALCTRTVLPTSGTNGKQVHKKQLTTSAFSAARVLLPASSPFESPAQNHVSGDRHFRSFEQPPSCLLGESHSEQVPAISMGILQYRFDVLSMRVHMGISCLTWALHFMIHLRAVRAVLF